MSAAEIMSKIFEVIIEAIEADCFELVVFDYRQQPFFSQSKGRPPVAPEKDRADLINSALKSGQPVISRLDHGQDALVACHPYFFQGKLYGYAYFEKSNNGDTSTRQEMEILSSALPAVKLLSREAALPPQLLVENDEDRTEFLGISQAARLIRELINKVKNVDSPVLICGESGTGKELVARLIHQTGHRQLGQFVAINCSAIPDSLLESELFGYARGSFTGALRDKPGLIEEANGGTFFLDEVGDLSLPLQAKLLRVLQEKELRRLGENRSRRIDVRFISATNRQLEAEINAGRFRQDLYYRLKIMVIDIPPLRRRPEDVLVLLNHFLDFYAREMNRPRAFYTPEALELLLKYDWPGNVREVQNEIQRDLILAGGEKIIQADWLSTPIKKSRDKVLTDRWDYSQAKADFEKKFLGEALRHFNYHRARTAAAIGLTRQGLFRLLKKHGLDQQKN
ncbi:MAG TPA: sigma-54 dependent transcriptional regulator [Candidatus Saccharicenans sp.]|jgi:transcriptional regulator with PAS, ATPase and Fis domain|nr:sigma-54 dependent transcriptional regulator [Candidatus Saccharicenans sp.]HNT01069.1 sigma-54 dependent transcriptional regulator [Candidatus Saccharicenans sp.]